MEKNNLVKIRTLYKEKLRKIRMIKELLNDDKCREFVRLCNLDINKYLVSDDDLLNDIISDLHIIKTNGIYVCTGTFLTHCDICYEETFFYRESLPFDSNEAEYRHYLDIENKHFVKAYVRPNTEKSITSSDFESNNIVLNPYSTSDDMNGFNEVRYYFFKSCIEYGQSKSKKLILEKYPRL